MYVDYCACCFVIIFVNVLSWVAWRLLALGVVPPRLLAIRVSAFAPSQARSRSRADLPSIVCVPPYAGTGDGLFPAVYYGPLSRRFVLR